MSCDLGTYENNCDNGKDHDRIALFCRFLRLLSGPSSFANIGMLLLQIKQVVELNDSAAIKILVTIHGYVLLHTFSMRDHQSP